jgi:putative DNA primase/helicase
MVLRQIDTVNNMNQVYDIALGNTRKDVKTTAVRWEWHELVARLKKVEYAEHTADLYKKMSKAQRIEAKDVGFFIGGFVQGRKVLYRQILSLDIDDANKQTLDLLHKWLKDKTYVLHSTHSSTPEEPRYRVIAPLSRAVQADEYGAIMRILHDVLKLPIDVATFDFNRIMFLPSVPKDVEYFFETKTGEQIDVDKTLEMAPDWRNLGTLKIERKQVQKPETKGGLIGAFCQRISIREAIETYLSHVWKKEPDGSYTLEGASTTSGGKIFEEKFLVSFHSTDKFLGRSHNAYDAIRLYKFGGGKTGDAEMVKLCEQLDIKAEGGGTFKATLESMSDEEAKAILAERLEVDKHGNLVKSLRNAEAILQYDPELSGVFGYDLFSDTPVLKRLPYWRVETHVRVESEDCKNVQAYEGMEDLDESYLRLHFEEKYGLKPQETLTDALNITAHKNAFHPVRDYLNSLEWDGVARLERIFIDCFGVPESRYSREVGLKFFVGAVRRVFIPASKMDYIPVLVSEEGLGKSRFIRRMAKLWGSDTFYTFNGSKEAYEQLRGVWIMEIPELNGIQNRSTNSRKAFVTKGEDRYRSAYLKYTKTYKRQCVFIASSNDVVFLEDPAEDGRRWWGLMCNPTRITINIHEDDFLNLVDMYWAEAVHHFRMGVLPVLSPGAEVEARMLRQVHKAENVEEGALIDSLNMPVPSNWYERTLFDRKNYWNNERELWRGQPRDAVCTTEVAREFFDLSRADMTPAQGRRIGDALRATGLFIQDGSRRVFGEYGQALAWIRKTSLVKSLNEANKTIKQTKDEKGKTKKDGNVDKSKK